MAVVPLLATNMDRLIACYYFRDMSSMGEQIDRVGMSEEFQKIVFKSKQFWNINIIKGVIKYLINNYYFKPAVNQSNL